MGSRALSLSRFAVGGSAAVLLGALSLGPAAAAAPPATAPPATASQAAPAGPAVPARPGQQSAHRLGHRAGSIPVDGTLRVQLDPSTLQATPAGGGAMCRLQVDVVLELAGTVEGTATGSTVATIDAPCADTVSTPPGTFSDTFRFTGDFEGSVSGVPAVAAVEYAGITRAGGDVSALLVLHDGVTVLAGVQAQAGAEGAYRGVALTRFFRGGSGFATGVPASGHGLG